MARTNASAVEGRRGPLRRLLDLWGIVPGYGRPHVEVTLRSVDDVRLAATYLPGPGPGAPAVVLAPGFAAHRRKPTYALLAERLSERAAVLVLDLRGHGGSAGACTLGDREVHDVTAGLAWLRRRGHGWVAAIGASMGGTAVVRAAGSGAGFDAVCAISAPAEWGLADSAPMRAIGRLPAHRGARALCRLLLRVRVAGGWDDPAPPGVLAAAIAPAPVLVVHGDDDHFFGVEQAELLHRAAGPGAVLWREPAGFGHAEDGFTSAFAERLADAVSAVRAHGRWPPRAVEPGRGPVEGLAGSPPPAARS